ncbi:antitermination protein [Klebsiella pneumoniae]|uniref:antitermination protein n=1 Tax=Klebsiella pneumoniae TaxID=573 RepID=UPI000EF21F7D|nr:antitermination protein [Klebsiella pneumoniae]RLK81613.1 antitermination protein [Klebsiella pneumoniae]RLK94438.1 antitermination protein [Klebsiella pneumoniae]
MKLEASLKHFSPQGMHISDDVKSTSPNRLTGTDVMAAIGTTSSRARFGLAAFLGKAGISKTDEQLAIQALAQFAIKNAPKNVRKAAGDKLGACMLTLAQFAFAEYSRSAATRATCQSCSGTGFISRHEDVIKHPGIFDADGVEVKAPKIRNELVKRVCGVCGGKKVIHARCRCSGKGEVLDRKATKELGAPVFKTCERCSGNGFSVVPSATVHRAILKRLPDLHQSSWSRNWKPFYEGLVDMLHKGESQAAAEFEKATIY